MTPEPTFRKRKAATKSIDKSKSESCSAIVKTPSKRKSGANRTKDKNAHLEEKCGLEEIIGLIYPHLVGEAVIGGEPFPCPLPMHRDQDKRLMRLTMGRKVAKPYWKCQAGCCKDKHNDTIDFIRSALGVPFPKAISLWAKLAAAAPEQRRSIIKKAFPNWKGKAA